MILILNYYLLVCVIADLITEKFDPNTLKNPSDKLMLDTCNESGKFWKGFIDKYGDIEAKVIE